MNPKKFGGLANCDQEPWKSPLGGFVENLYQKHFKKPAPATVRSIEKMVNAEKAKKELKKARKEAEKAAIETKPENETK